MLIRDVPGPGFGQGLALVAGHAGAGAVHESPGQRKGWFHEDAVGPILPWSVHTEERGRSSFAGPALDRRNPPAARSLLAQAHAAHRAGDTGHGVDTVAHDVAQVIEAAGLDHANDVVWPCDAVDLNGLFE